MNRIALYDFRHRDGARNGVRDFNRSGLGAGIGLVEVPPRDGVGGRGEGECAEENAEEDEEAAEGFGL